MRLLATQLKRIFLFCVFVFSGLCNCSAYTFNWTGLGGNTAWTTAGNWTSSGTGTGTADYPGGNSRTDDIVNFGVSSGPYLVQPTLSVNVTVASVNFGQLQYNGTLGAILAGTSLTGSVLTVNSTLTVTGNITQDYTGSTNGTIFNDIRGSGSITCNNIIFGNTSNVTTTNQAFLFLEVNTLKVSNNVNIHINVKAQNGSGVRLEGGTMTIGGQITFTNHGSSSLNSGYFTINSLTTYKISNTVTNPTLILTNANAIATIPTPYASVNFNGASTSGGKGTVIYTGVSPTVYTTGTPGFGTGGGTINPAIAQYDNLTINATGTAKIGAAAGTLKTDSIFTTTTPATLANFATSLIVGTDWNNTSTITGGSGTTDVNRDLNNSGAMTMGTGALTIARNYTNTGTFTPNASALISFDGTTQTLTDATATGTNFYNVTFTTGGTKTMASGSNFTIAPTYTLNVNSSATLAVSNATANTTALTLLSTSSGDASIGNLSAGTITGSINVQRYVKGTLRRYMLMSSPVLNTTTTFTTPAGAMGTYNLLPLIATTFITGPGGSANGFDDAPATGNSPSVFVYDENAPVTANVNQVLNNEYKPFSSTSQGLPPANGFLYYFRGSRSVVNPFVRPFPATDNATLNFFGTVIKGTGASNAQLTANVVNFPNTPPLYYTATAVGAPATLSFHSTTPSAKQGLNLIGNPYASVIDLRALYLANTSNKFYYMLIRDASTGANSSSTKFALYDASVGTTGSAATGASRYALSGQGFFTIATSASAIKFDETMKVAYSNYSPPVNPVFNVIRNVGTNMSASFAANNSVAETNVIPRLRMELVQDTVVHNSTDINFDSNSGSKFVQGEDAPYYQPSGQGDIFYSLSSDSVGCFANYTGSLEKLKRIGLVVTFSAYGKYKLTFPLKSSIDARYSILLEDRYLKDSVDVMRNAEYAFAVDANPASYAHNRFALVIGIVPGHDYHLLSFTGAKVSQGIKLNWQTDNESDFTFFDLQKSIDGGKIFFTIDSLRSSGSGNYSFIDPAPGSGQILYRLSQHLVTGENKLSDNLKFDVAALAGSDKFQVYPTVVSGSLVNIKLREALADQLQISIVSPSGVIVKRLSTKSSNTIQENVSDLSRGLYIVVAVNEATGDRIGSGMFYKQ